MAHRGGVHRRGVLGLLGCAATFASLQHRAFGSDYPTRPVRIIVGFAPGGVPDLVARLAGQWVSERLGQPFVVENHLGAASNLALEDVTRAAPDGYTLVELSVANAINVSLYQNAVDIENDIAPIVCIASAPFVIVVTPSSRAQTIPDLIAYAKSQPGKLNIGSPAIGTPPYLAISLFKSMTGVDVAQIPYRNSTAAIDDLLGGRIDVAISDMSVMEYVKSGKLHGLAVTTATRQKAIASVPSLAEFLPGYEATSWYGLGAAKQTPAEIINVLSAAATAALTKPENIAHFASLGLTVDLRSPAAFGRFVADQTKKWSAVIKAANIKPQ
jgi:tripartite-type tricarboxylate transporter receptor subunit TctC